MIKIIMIFMAIIFGILLGYYITYIVCERLMQIHNSLTLCITKLVVGQVLTIEYKINCYSYYAIIPDSNEDVIVYIKNNKLKTGDNVVIKKIKDYKIYVQKI